MIGPPPRARLRGVLACAGALAACSDGRGESRFAMDVEALPRIAAVEELRIGSLDDPTTGFSSIRAVTVAEDGRVFVLEATDRQIRVYGADGTPIRTIGRQGSGPGELANPSMFGVVGDTLWVTDFGNRRITLFSVAGGEVLATVPQTAVEIPVQAAGMTVSVLPAMMRPDGLFTGSVQVSFRGGAPPGAIDSVHVPSLLFDASGAVVDTLAWSWVRMGGGPSNLVQVGGTMLVVTNPIDNAPLTGGIGGDSLVVERGPPASGDAGELAVLRLGPSGDTVYERRFRYRARAVPVAFMDSVVSSHLERVPAVPNRGELERAVRAALPPVPFFPPVVSRRLGGDESVWLRRDDDGGEEARWIVLRPDGTPRGELRLPKQATVHWSEGDALWAVEPDAYGVPWLVRYRLEDG